MSLKSTSLISVLVTAPDLLNEGCFSRHSRTVLYLPSFHPSKALGAVRVVEILTAFFLQSAWLREMLLLETARLTLQPFTPADLDFLHAFQANRLVK